MGPRLAAVLLASVVAAACSSGDDQVFLEEADPPGVACAAGVEVEVLPEIDLGAVRVDDLRDRAEQRGEMVVLAFDVVTEPATAESTQVILQARSAGTVVTLRAPDVVDAVGEDVSTAVLALGRCAAATRYRVEVALSEPGCVFIIGADPELASFTQLPVPMLVDGCGDDALVPAD